MSERDLAAERQNRTVCGTEMTDAAICPNCGKPVETHEMFDPPRCPVIRLRWPSDTPFPGAIEFCRSTLGQTQCAHERTPTDLDKAESQH